jgi:hypothetical protein
MGKVESTQNSTKYDVLKRKRERERESERERERERVHLKSQNDTLKLETD